MAGLHLYRSNRVETLAGRLAELLATPLRDPLQAEWVVVQSLGMRRWLSFQIAGRLGIAMNCWFPFFADFAQRVFRAALPGEPMELRAFAREILPWRILAEFPRALPQPEFAELRRYIGADEASELKTYQLARQIGTVFDQYMAYLPEQLLAWETGAEAHWQARLWRTLAAGRAHAPALAQRLGAARGGAWPELPERISIFGLASLPPLYLRLLAEVCHTREVHLFLFEPTEHFWGDLQSQAEQARFLKRHGRPGQSAADLHLEAGNELLASLGRAGRAFTSAVLELEPVEEIDCFTPPERPGLLGQLQADIFQLREPGEPMRPESTVQIHCAHGPMREVEVLHDQLLALFESLPGLTPKDVLVTMPEIETHAPFIDAVFGAPESEAVRIPYSIADRSVQAVSGVARTFLRLLDLAGSRFGAGAVLELLETRAVRERFELGEGDLETIHTWVERNHIRWGFDAEHRAEFGVPPFAQNSWRAGLDRLLLGYAWAGEGGATFAGVRPDADLEGSLAALLGRWAEMVELLFEQVRALAAPRSPRAWSETLQRLLGQFFSDRGPEAAEVLQLGRTLGAIAEWEEHHPAPLGLPVVRAALRGSLGEAAGASGFLAGHVTFCSLKPMRSIPFRVICMLGMDDGAFPRRDVPAPFDLLAQAGPAAAGRSRREEDRQLFLEALLSARDVFYLSYSGLSSKDNRESPPSVVVSELLDYLATGLPATEAEPDPRRRFVIRHRLQPFSPEYFSGEGSLFSYSQENARLQTASEPPAAPFAGEPLPEAERDWHALELRPLIDFLRLPARHFLAERLGVRLPRLEEARAEAEPMALDHLQRWELAQRLAAGGLAGLSEEQLLAGALAEGGLPPASFGAAAHGAAHRAIRGLLQRVEALPLGLPLPPRALTVVGEGWSLSGTLEGLHERALRLHTGWKLDPRERLRAWLSHLLLNAAAAPGLPRTTWLLAPEAALELEPVAEARALLHDLIMLYREGLRRPLPFFPRSSFELARRTAAGPSQRTAKTPAEMAQGVFATQEASLPEVELCFGHLAHPCGAEWEALSLRVWHPALLA